MGPFYVSQSNPAHRLADPTQLKFKNLNPTQTNGTKELCCSQGQNPKAKDEAKARTLEAETKAWTLQGQGRGLDPRDQDQGQSSWVQ